MGEKLNGDEELKESSGNSHIQGGDVNFQIAVKIFGLFTLDLSLTSK